MPDLHQTVVTMTQRVKDLLARSDPLSEEDTKAVLIEPTIAALGWDVHDPSEVRREYRYPGQGGAVDYALLTSGKPALFIEAKSIGANVRDYRHRAQAVNYANNAGVEWCALTDGNVWHIYRSNAPGDLEQKLFLETWFYSQGQGIPPFEASQVLALLSKSSVEQNALATQWEKLYPAVAQKRAQAAQAKPKQPAETPRGATTALPSVKEVEVPLLRAMVRRGGTVDWRAGAHEIENELADFFQLPAVPRETRAPRMDATVWGARVHCTRGFLVTSGDVSSVRAGVWTVTEKGRQRVEREG